VSNKPDTLIAKSRINGRKSSEKSCTADAPSSRIRRRIASITPGITSTAATSRP